MGQSLQYYVCSISVIAFAGTGVVISMQTIFEKLGAIRLASYANRGRGTLEAFKIHLFLDFNVFYFNQVLLKIHNPVRQEPNNIYRCL